VRKIETVVFFGGFTIMSSALSPQLRLVVEKYPSTRSAVLRREKSALIFTGMDCAQLLEPTFIFSRATQPAIESQLHVVVACA
jgi:hypothetical protein